MRRDPAIPVTEMTDERRQEFKSRTLLISGFPNASYKDVLNFFNTFSVMENVYMRYFRDPSHELRLFKGSVFATFKYRHHVRNCLLSQLQQFIASSRFDLFI